ncbi:MAG: hypothetical protein JWO63_1028 [Frankiales bacterium]|jgi:hypothetical protein|nr:hypothetical protein [Frankiales bacterium]
MQETFSELVFSAVNDLQEEVAKAADGAEAHSTAPALLLQAQAALGSLSASADAATESGRKPYRVPVDWGDKLAELAYVVYLLADQTGVALDASVRSVSARVSADAARRRADRSASENERWL